MPIVGSDINDLVAGTLRKMKPTGFHLIAQELQDYEVMGKWLKKDRVVFDGGYGIQRNLMDALDNVAAHKGLFEEDNVNVADHLTQMKVDYVHADTKFAIEHREVLMNSGDTFVTSILEVRRTNAMLALASELEEKAWEVRAEATTTEPNGIPYYVTYSGTAGFNGTVPSGWSGTTVANVDTAVHTNYANYTDIYVTASMDDLVKKMRTAKRMCKFKSPMSLKQFRGPLGERVRIYVDETTISIFEDMVTARNENLGIDLATYDGQAVFRKHPIIWVPYLDDHAADGSNPVYMIDHAAFFPAVLKGDFFRQTGPRPAAKQHNVSETFYDISYNYLCVNRKSCALIAKAEPFT